MAIVDLVQTGFASPVIAWGKGFVAMARPMMWYLQKMVLAVGHTGDDDIRLLNVAWQS